MSHAVILEIYNNIATQTAIQKEIDYWQTQIQTLSMPISEIRDPLDQNLLLLSAKYRINRLFKIACQQDKNFDFTAVDNSGMNILHLACSTMNLDLIDYILHDLKLIALCNQQDMSGSTPLHHLYFHFARIPSSQKEEAQRLIDEMQKMPCSSMLNNRGLTPAQMQGKTFEVFGFTQLHLLMMQYASKLDSSAQRAEFEQKLQALLVTDPSLLNQANDMRHTPLTFAIYLGQPKMVEALLQQSKIEISSSGPLQPIFLAAFAYPKNIRKADDGVSPDQACFWLLYNYAKKHSIVMDYSTLLQPLAGYLYGKKLLEEITGKDALSLQSLTLIAQQSIPNPSPACEQDHAAKACSYRP